MRVVVLTLKNIIIHYDGTAFSEESILIRTIAIEIERYVTLSKALLFALRARHRLGKNCPSGHGKTTQKKDRHKRLETRIHNERQVWA